MAVSRAEGANEAGSARFFAGLVASDVVSCCGTFDLGFSKCEAGDDDQATPALLEGNPEVSFGGSGGNDGYENDSCCGREGYFISEDFSGDAPVKSIILGASFSSKDC